MNSKLNEYAKIFTFIVVLSFASVSMADKNMLSSPKSPTKAWYISKWKSGVAWKTDTGFILRSGKDQVRLLSAVIDNIRPNEEYELSFNAWSAKPKKKLKALFYTKFKKGQRHWFKQKEYILTAQKTKCTFRVRIPDAKNWQKRQLQIIFSSSNSTIYIEQPTLVKVEEKVIAYSKNLLQGDTDFETGIGSWAYSGAIEQLSTFKGDGAFGKSCIEISPVSWLVMNKWLWYVLKRKKNYILSFYAKGVKGGESIEGGLMNLRYRKLGRISIKLTKSWKRYTVPIGKLKNTETAFVFFSFINRNPNVKVRIDAVQLEEGSKATSYVHSEKLSMYGTIDCPGEIITYGKIPKLRISILNSSPAKASLALTLTLNFPKRLNRSEKIDIKSGELKSFRISCDFAKEVGYYPIKAVLTDKKGTVYSKQFFPFVVAPKFSHKKRTDSFFGIQPFRIPISVLPLIGATWLRLDATRWANLEPYESKLGKANNFNNKKMFNLQCMLGDFSKPPRWAKQANNSLADPTKIRGYVRTVLRDSQKNASCYEFQNEPNLTMVRVPNGSFEAAVDTYSKILQNAYPIMHSAGAKVMANVSGNGLKFAAEVFARAANSFDIFSVHPYCSPRTLGDLGRYCPTPESGGFVRAMEESSKLIRRYGSKHQLVAGEVGWSMNANAPCNSKAAMLHAAYLARMVILARTYPECSHIIWYNALGMPEEGNYEYGIWRNDNGIRPLPAVAAYSQAAREFDYIQSCKLIRNDDIKIIEYQKDGITKFAIWNSEVETENILLKFKNATVDNIYGTPCGKTLRLSPYPYYVLPNPGQVDACRKSIFEQLNKSCPLRINASIVNRNTLQLILRNRSNVPWNGKLTIKNSSILKKVNAKSSDKVLVKLKKTVTNTPVPIELKLSSVSGDKHNIKLIFPAMTPIKKLNISDWKTFDFQKLKPQLVLNSRKYIFPPDPSVNWNGPTDLSLSALPAWDEQFFYIFAVVSDNKHCNPYRDGDIWKGDSLQLAFDMKNDAFPGATYNKNDYEYGFASGVDAWCWYASVGKSFSVKNKINYTIERNKNGKMVYRISIPWRELGKAEVKQGDIFAYALKLNDYDVNEKNYYLAWGHGIFGAKNPAKFNKIILVE